MAKITFTREKSEHGKVTSFHVFWLSMGNRIGVGNIIGPVTAILLGGPGAIFWMWIFATIGAATSFVETTVGQIYKSRSPEGHFIGGPAYNVSKGLRMKKLGITVAVIMILVYIGGYVLSEICTISTSFTAAFEFEHNTLVISLILTAIAVLVVLGGFKRVAQASVALVPGMAVLWIACCIGVIILNFDGISNAISSIFTNAFFVPSAVGGGIGAMITWALRRGIWSNEAGEGTTTNISSSADVSHPCMQGLSQSFGVLIDTLVCTVTALVILSFADYEALVDLDMGESELIQHIFSGAMGGIAPTVVFLFMFVFAITCFMGDVVIGHNNLRFITENRYAKYGMYVFIIAVVFLSSYYASEGLYAIMDVFLGVAAIINCYVMFRLSKRALEAYDDYRAQKEAGIENPVFHKSVLSDQTGVTEWDDRIAMAQGTIRRFGEWCKGRDLNSRTAKD